MTSNPFEIPDQICDLAERSVEQARTAYGQFMDAMLKAQSTSLTSVPATAMSTNFSDIQERAINFARRNFEASFSLATDLARAKDIAAVLDVQKRFAQSQMQAYAMEAQELGADNDGGPERDATLRRARSGSADPVASVANLDVGGY